jgi:hypothetical protein
MNYRYRFSSNAPKDSNTKFQIRKNQCCGSMTFWCGSGSGSADPCIWLMDPDPDPDPAIFIIDLQDANKKLILKKSFSAYYFLKVHTGIYHFSKIKCQKKSKKSRNEGFSYYFCLMIEGSGSRRPKNMRIRWIRIRIRFHNTWKNTFFL